MSEERDHGYDWDAEAFYRIEDDWEGEGEPPIPEPTEIVEVEGRRYFLFRDGSAFMTGPNNYEWRSNPEYESDDDYQDNEDDEWEDWTKYFTPLRRREQD